MNKSGQLALIRSTLSAIPVHITKNLKLDAWAMKALEKIMKAFLWIGTDTIINGKCSVAWAHVQRPRDLGGLGILDPVRFGQALQLRWLWLRRTSPDCPWSSLPADEERPLLTFFWHSVRIEVGNGSSIFF